MPDLLPGTTVRGEDTPPTVSATVSASADTTSTTFTAPPDDCAVVFTACTTGRAIVHICARITNTGAANGGLVGVQIREGSVIGSGTIVEDAADDRAVRTSGTLFYRAGITHLVSGLTPGVAYNARLLFRTSSGTSTASVAWRELIVEPAT